MERTYSFGYWLRRRRKALDLTQAQLAQQVNCSLDLIQKIETDRRRPSRPLAEQLANCLRLEGDERVAFLQAARAERAVDQLPLPTHPLVPPLAALPEGTVTFMFTDIVGSTRLLQRLGNRYADVLMTHQQLTRTAVAAWHGHEIDTQGDAFFVAFERASDALGAAVAIQRALAAHPWQEGGAVQVRMGVHRCYQLLALRQSSRKASTCVYCSCGISL
jgi:class 3 adenylate cyclase